MGTTVLPSWFPNYETHPFESGDDEFYVDAISPGTRIIEQYKVNNQAIMGESDTSMIRNALLDAMAICPTHCVALGSHIDLIFPRPLTPHKIRFTVLENASLHLLSERLSILKGFELQCKDRNKRWIRVLKINDVAASCLVTQKGAIQHCELSVRSVRILILDFQHSNINTQIHTGTLKFLFHVLAFEKFSWYERFRVGMLFLEF